MIRVVMVWLFFWVRALSGGLMVQGMLSLMSFLCAVDFGLNCLGWRGSRVLGLYALRCGRAGRGRSQPTPNPLRD